MATCLMLRRSGRRSAPSRTDWSTSVGNMVYLYTSRIEPSHADASAGTVNISHDGTPIAGVAAPDISRGFSGIPRSAQPPLTTSQQRILECTHRVAAANADIPYTLFVPSTYAAQKPAPLVVDLHGLNITPLQQILFDGTTDFAERHVHSLSATRWLATA